MASTIESLITKIKTLPDKNQRSIASLLGATVADVATRPLHWVYDQQTLDDVIGNKKETEFWPESKCPFYRIDLGLPSCYNDMALACLSSMNETNGKHDIKHVCETLKKHFGTGSDYAEAFANRPTDRAKLPMEGPWRQKGLTRFLEKYEKGQTEDLGDVENKEYDGFCVALPVIIKYAGEKDMWAEASKLTALLNMNEPVTNMYHAASILVSTFIMGENNPMAHVKETIHSLYPDVYTIMEEVEEAKSLPFISTVAKFGKACYLPGSFQGALLAMLQTSSYVDAVRLNITAGGCSCSRGNLIGACYGAKYGIDGIPVDWLKKVKDIEKICEMAINVFSANK